MGEIVRYLGVLDKRIFGGVYCYSQTREHRQNAPYSESNIRLKPIYISSSRIIMVLTSLMPFEEEIEN